MITGQIQVIKENYFDKYHKDIKPIMFYTNVNGCWLCISHCLNNSGYPGIGRNRKSTTVARYLYEKEYGEIEKGLFVRHKCDNPQCINVKHLELGTVKDNHRDMVERGRSTRGIKHPKNKLTEKEVREIRKDNRVHRIIAKDYNVCSVLISLIKNYKRWGWLKY